MRYLFSRIVRYLLVVDIRISGYDMTRERTEGVCRSLSDGGGDGPSSARHEGVPVRVDAEVVPVYPGQPGGQIAGVPVNTPRGPELTSEALLDVLNWLQVAEKDLSEEGDVGNGQTEGVDLAEPLLVRKGGDVSPELLEVCVDTGAAGQGMC